MWSLLTIDHVPIYVNLQAGYLYNVPLNFHNIPARKLNGKCPIKMDELPMIYLFFTWWFFIS